MPLEWGNNINYTVESGKLGGGGGGEAKLGVRNPRASHPLYETLHVCTSYMYITDTRDVCMSFTALSPQAASCSLTLVQ